MGPVKPRFITSKFDDSDLHAETDPKIGYGVLARKPDRLDLALDTPSTKPPGHQDGVHAFKAGGAFAFDTLGVHIGEIHLSAGTQSPVGEGFGERFIGLGQTHIFADHGNGNLG